MVNEAENDNDGLTEAGRLDTLGSAGKKEVGMRIHRRMLALGWRQADLARASDLSRNSISNYIKGNQAPSGTSLVALAKALRVKPADLMPEFKTPVEGARETPAYSMQVDSSGLAHLIVSKKVTSATAFEIMRLLEADSANQSSDGSAGGGSAAVQPGKN